MPRRDICPLRRAGVAYAVSIVVVVAATLVTCGRFTRTAASDCLSSFVARARCALALRDPR